METLVALTRFLQHAPDKHVLFLVSPKRKALLLDYWRQDMADGKKAFSVTAQPQEAQQAQVCLACVFDIQIKVGVDRTVPFFDLFDAVILGDPPGTQHGPAWHQIIEIFRLKEIRLVEFRALLSEEIVL